MLGLRMATSSSRDSGNRREEASRRRWKYDRDDYDDSQYSRRYRDNSEVRSPRSAPITEPVPVYRVAPPPSNATTEFERRQQLRMEKSDRHERRLAKKERRERRLEMEERERELEVRQKELDVQRGELEVRRSRGLDDALGSPRAEARRSRGLGEAVGERDSYVNDYVEDPSIRIARGRRPRAPLEEFLRSQRDV